MSLNGIRPKNVAGDKSDYYFILRHRSIFIILCLVLAIIVMGLSLTVGFYDVGFFECYQIIWQHITGNIVDVRGDSFVWGIRLPIALYAIICGAVLSIGGAVMQSILRNPLADPYMMGISSGASLGVTLAIIAGVSISASISASASIVLMAFLFSLIPMAVILIFSIKRRTTPTKIILIGVAVSYVFSACTSLLMVTASEESLAEVYAWNVGSLATITWDSIPIPLTVSIIGFLALMAMNRSINVMMSGNKTAHSLGINTKRTTMILMLIVSLMTAAVVSFCGTIGFIGLVGPHIARIFVGSESRYLLPASATFGAVFLLISNSIASVAGQAGLPVGVVSAVIGCPLFILILLRMRKNAWA